MRFKHLPDRITRRRSTIQKTRNFFSTAAPKWSTSKCWHRERQRRRNGSPVGRPGASLRLLRAFHPSHHVRDELVLAVGISHAIVCKFCRQFYFEAFIVARHVRMLNEVIPEQQLIPVLLETFFHHVDVMSTGARLRIALDEPGIERRDIVAVRRAPEVIVALYFEQGRNADA